MNPDQTAPYEQHDRLLLRSEQSDLGLHCLKKRLLKHLGRKHYQTTLVVIDALRACTCMF